MLDKRELQLVDAMASVIIFPEDTFLFLDKAEISKAEIAFSKKPNVLWYNIVEYSKNNGQLDDLVEALLASYPKNPHLLTFKEGKIKDYSMGPDIRNEVEWKNEDPMVFEKITGKVNTLLPIRFLSIGLKRAKSVARVVIEKDGREELGSGFLIQDNFFITNHHVIDSVETALLARIEFNYEESDSENPIGPTPFCLEPKKGFSTSKENDWTVIKVKGNPNKLFGKIELKGTKTHIDDFVNIIQHPGGRYKQIGLYHNMVTYCNDKVVQYLTDTEPGSSGSPVFNSNWELVALHHSSGMFRDPGSSVPLMRNEGINIQIVIDGAKKILTKT